MLIRRTSPTLERWKSLSAERGWRIPEDWPCPAAAEILDTFTARGNLEAGIVRLATHRAIQGVGIGEGLEDLYALFDTLRSLPVREERLLARAFASAWVVETERFVSEASCTDPASGLSTLPHFSRRLYELYDDVRTTPQTENVIAVLRVPTVGMSHQEQSEYRAQLGARATALMGPVGAVMSFSGSALLILIRRESRAFTQLDELKRAAGVLPLTPNGVHLDLEPLPALPEHVLRLLDSLTGS